MIQVAIKVLRKVMVQNVREKLIKVRNASVAGMF